MDLERSNGASRRVLSPLSGAVPLSGLALALALCLVSPTWSLLCKNAVDLIALGHSPAKTIAFLAFLLSVSLASRTRLPTPYDRTLPVLSLSLLTCGTFSLSEYLWYCKRFGLVAADGSSVMRDGYWSSTSLVHIHTSKVLLSPLFGGLAHVTDAGYPFAPLFPQWLILLHLVLFLAVLALSWLGALWAFRQRSPGQALALTLAIFALAKNTVDGGPLSPEVWSALPIYVGVWRGRKPAIAATALLLLYPLALSAPYSAIFWRIPCNVLVLALPLIFERVSWKGWVGLALVACSLYLSPLLMRRLVPDFGWQPYALNLLIYGRLPLAAGQKVWLLVTPAEEARAAASLPILERTPCGPFLLLRAKLVGATTPLELCHQLRLPISRRPITWYVGDMEFQAQARAVDGPLQPALDSPLVRDSVVDQAGEFTRYRLHLAPGVNDNSALALLGPQLTVLREVRLRRWGGEKAAAGMSGLKD